MAFLKINNNGSVTRRRVSKNKCKVRRKSKGIVYILAMWLGAKDSLRKVYKIGVTARTTRPLETRISEICADHFQKMRFFPMVDPRKFSKTKYYFEVEAFLHQQYKEYRYYPEVKFDGSTELFIIDDEDKLMELYTLVMKDPLNFITPTESEDVAQTDAVPDIAINDIEPVII